MGILNTLRSVVIGNESSDSKHDSSVRASLTTLTLLSLSAMQGAAKAQDPEKALKELFDLKPAPTKVEDFPRNIPSVFCDPKNSKLQDHWKKVQSKLEAKLLDPRSTETEQHAEDSELPLEQEWQEVRQDVVTSGVLEVNDDGEFTGDFEYPHAYAAASIRETEGGCTVTVAVKLFQSKRRVVLNDEFGIKKTVEENSEEFVHDGGCMEWQVTDQAGKVFRGKTQKNGVGILECKGAVYPCRVQFLERVAEEEPKKGEIKKNGNPPGAEGEAGLG